MLKPVCDLSEELLAGTVDTMPVLRLGRTRILGGRDRRGSAEHRIEIVEAILASEGRLGRTAGYWSSATQPPAYAGRKLFLELGIIWGRLCLVGNLDGCDQISGELQCN